MSSVVAATPQCALGSTVKALADRLARHGGLIEEGAATLPATLIVSDYTCLPCRALEKRLAVDGPPSRRIFLPVGVYGPRAERAAAWAFAAATLGRGLAMHHALMAMPLPVTPINLDNAARRAGLEPEEVERASRSDIVQQLLDIAADAFQTLPIEAVPTVIAGCRRVDPAAVGRTAPEIIKRFDDNSTR